jgi:predicted dehydrogenase
MSSGAPSESDVLNVGIVGYGLAGQVFHGPLIAVTEALEIAKISTSDSGRQALARERYPGAEIVDSVDKLWDGIDVVVVAAPHAAHVALATAALDRGLAVVVDKPLSGATLYPSCRVAMTREGISARRCRSSGG